jgi:hypothetical protein
MVDSSDVYRDVDPNQFVSFVLRRCYICPYERTFRAGLVVAGRIPFPFTLIDKRHRPFVDGQRDTLLTLPQVVGPLPYAALVGLMLGGSLPLFFDPISRGRVFWGFLGLAAIVLGFGGYAMRSAISNYRALCRLAYSGQPLPGEIIKVQPVYRHDTIDMKITYLAKMADGTHMAWDLTWNQSQLGNLVGPALPGTKVAIWYDEKEGAVLL